MLVLEECFEFDAPAEQIWSIVGDFGGLHRWVAGVETLAVTGTLPGAERTIRVRSAEFRERLEELNAPSMRLSYRLLRGAFPASNYFSSLQVDAMGSARSRVRWSARCEPLGVPAEKLEKGLRKSYRENLAHLAQVINTPDHR